LLPETCGGSRPSLALDGDNHLHISYDACSSLNGSYDLIYTCSGYWIYLLLLLINYWCSV
jgi:hypothetical protein